MVNFNVISDNFLIILLFIFAPVSGYLVYEALKLRDRNTQISAENDHLKEDLKKTERNDKIKTEFISIAVHQLRTPLTKLKWALQALNGANMECLSPNYKEMVETAEDANNKMIRLVNDLMGARESEESNLGYDFQSSDVKDVVNKTVTNFKFMAQQKKIELTLSDTTLSLPKIMIDPWKINLALGNLIDNAINYTPEGGAIKVKLESFGNSVRISVQDNGIGIPEKEKEKIFARFFRATNANKIKPDGTGLGLYIARNIIKVHGGELWFNSVETKGTTFYFTLPFDAALRAKEKIKDFVDGM